MKTKIEQALLILFLISIPFLLYFLISTKSELILNGKVIDFGATTDEGGVHSFLIIKLEDNRTVNVYYRDTNGLHIGREVIIKERTTNLLNIRNFLFIRWNP